MKCSEFQAVLDAFATICGIDGERSANVELKAAGKLLAIAPSKTVAAIVAALSKNLDIQSGSNQDESLLTDLANFLHKFGKPVVAKDAAALAGLIAGQDAPSVEQIVAHAEAVLLKQRNTKASKNTPSEEIRQDIVAAYNRRLEQALGDDPGFTALLAVIESDKNLNTSEVVALSKMFSLKNARTRLAALKNIRARHQSLMTSRAKAAATAGRIAG